MPEQNETADPNQPLPSPQPPRADPVTDQGPVPGGPTVTEQAPPPASPEAEKVAPDAWTPNSKG